MVVTEPRPPVAPRSGRLVWGWIVVLTAVFVGLTAYRVRARDRHEVDEAKLGELSTATAQPATQAAGLDWPQWRGRERDGSSSETGLLPAWPEDGPALLWSQPSGAGYASVVIAQGRAVTLVQDGEDEAVVCWDAATGQEQWRFRYAAHFRHPQFGDGPRSTPAIVGDLVYTVGGTGLMHCLKLQPTTPTGAVVWRKNLLDDFQGTVPVWGVSFSPLIENGLVYVMPGGSAGKSLAALDAGTGAVVWQACDDPASYSSPVAADLAGQRQIVFLTAERLIGVTPATGKLLWEFPWPSGPAHTPSSIGTPLVIHRDVGDYLFIASGYDKGCALIKIERDGAGLQANQVYRKSTLRAVFSSAVSQGEALFGFDDANLACIDLRNGKRLWKSSGRDERHGGEDDSFGKGTLILADGKLIVHGANGQVALVAAEPDRYRELGRFTVSSQQHMTWTPPSLADGRLYLRDWTAVKCYRVK